MIIDHGLRLVFLHVPKCAGTALRRAFLDASGDRDVVSFFDFGFNPILRRQVDLAHLPLMDLRHCPEWRYLKRYRVMACIRHPYERLASACREYLRQKSRESELQMRHQPPSRDQLLDYLRQLPAAMESHDLRYVHGFPITWFTHYGEQPMVHQLLRCDQLAEDLSQWSRQQRLPAELQERLLQVAQGSGRAATVTLEALTTDQDLQAMANLLHRDDFRTFGFERRPARFQDPQLQAQIKACQAITTSHDLPLTSLTPQMRWYYGRSSNRRELVMLPTRADKRRHAGRSQR